jgi:hypothetical protein
MKIFIFKKKNIFTLYDGARGLSMSGYFFFVKKCFFFVQSMYKKKIKKNKNSVGRTQRGWHWEPTPGP